MRLPSDSLPTDFNVLAIDLDRVKLLGSRGESTLDFSTENESVLVPLISKDSVVFNDSILIAPLTSALCACARRRERRVSMLVLAGVSPISSAPTVLTPQTD